jgi:2-C-methyl-D-erythritol 4-phosphate cytidylyltransferase
MKNKISAIITAAGKSVRMNLPVKKQFMQLAGKPIIVHTVEKFLKAKIFDKIIITISLEDRKLAEKILFSEYNLPKKKFIIVDGGVTRQQSVFNALKMCSKSTDYVVIHDGVRPLVKVKEIQEIVKLTEEKRAVTLGIPVKNTIKRIKQNRVISTLDREQLWEIFTPQAFWFQIIYDAHKQAVDTGFFANDDAELVEILGKDVFVLQGSLENIKITDKFDLKIAEAILSNAYP